MKRLLLFIIISHMAMPLMAQYTTDDSIPQVIKTSVGVDYIMSEDGEFISRIDWMNQYGGKAFRDYWGANITFDEADHIKIGADTLWNYKQTVARGSNNTYYWSRVIRTAQSTDNLLREALSRLNDVTVADNTISGQVEGVFMATRDNKIWSLEGWDYKATVMFIFRDGRYKIIVQNILVTPIIDEISVRGNWLSATKDLSDTPIELVLEYDDLNPRKFTQMVEDIDYSFYSKLCIKDTVTDIENDW